MKNATRYNPDWPPLQSELSILLFIDLFIYSFKPLTSGDIELSRNKQKNYTKTTPKKKKKKGVTSVQILKHTTENLSREHQH